MGDTVALEPLKTVESPEELTDATRRILTSFYRKIISEGPLDRADDCFMLARALVRNRNFQMAAVVLKKADNKLELYVRSTPLKRASADSTENEGADHHSTIV
jgi:hypothetical protein